jgi:hypothetical protein
MAEFFALCGGYLGTGESCQDVIELFSEALEKAKRGEIIGAAIAIVSGNNQIMDTYASGHAESGTLMLSVHSLHTRITKVWQENCFQDCKDILS